jgi:hypothetical protein
LDEITKQLNHLGVSRRTPVSFSCGELNWNTDLI